MKHIKIEKDNYAIHILKTKKFKTVSIDVVFKTPVKKELITTRIFLTSLLVYSNKTYKTNKELLLAALDLYDAKISSSIAIEGNYILTKFNLNIINDKYIEEKLLEKGIKLFLDIIFTPNVINKSFDSDAFKIIFNKVENIIKTKKEDTARYSLENILEKNYPDDPISYNVRGYQKDLENIDSEKIYESYLDMINEDNFDVFVIGDVSNGNIEKVLEENLKINIRKKYKKEFLIIPKKKSFPLEQKQKEKFNQARLNLVFEMKDMSLFERYNTLTLYAAVLGWGPESLLFREVREKESLCYSITALPIRYSNLFIITTGIEVSKYNLAVKIIKKCLKKIADGDITEETFNTIKSYINAQYDLLEDSIERGTSIYWLDGLIEPVDISKRRTGLEKITIDDLKEFSKKINLEVISISAGGTYDN